MTNEEELFGRLRVWIDGIWEEVARLFFLNHIFWEVQDIIRDNPNCRETQTISTIAFTNGKTSRIRELRSQLAI